MASKRDQATSERGPLRRLVSSIQHLFGRDGKDPIPNETPAAAPRRQAEPQGTARTTRRKADIPLDVLDRSYTPALTSSKASFRTDGADHQHDQEFAQGVADERWNDEDHYTNKSGDPRIGTRGRTYEPGENPAVTKND